MLFWIMFDYLYLLFKIGNCVEFDVLGLCELVDGGCVMFDLVLCVVIYIDWIVCGWVWYVYVCSVMLNNFVNCWMCCVDGWFGCGI